MRSCSILLICVAAFFVLNVSGCSGLHPGSVDRTVEGDYDQVFRATVRMLRHRQFPLKRVDREEGQIVTGQRPLQAIQSARPVEKVDARIKGEEEGETKVRLLLVFVDQGSGAPRPVSRDGDEERADDFLDEAYSRSIEASVVYDEYLDAIQKRVKLLRKNSTP